MWKKILKDIKKHKILYALSIPVILYYVIFCYLPMFGVVMAFQNYRVTKGIWASEWVGFKHFITFFNDIYFGRLMRNTIMLNVYDIIFNFPVPIILALLLNELRSKRLLKSIQTCIYVPHFISLVVICGIILDFCATEGVANDILEWFGIERFNMLVIPELYKPIYLVSNTWEFAGWGSIVYMAAISCVNTELYDAAYVDGCGRWRRIWYVTLPGILPTVVIMFILRMGSLLSVSYEKTMLLYNPLTYESADVISTYVYRKGMLDANFSYASAIGLFGAVISIGFIAITNAVSRKLTENSLW